MPGIETYTQKYTKDDLLKLVEESNRDLSTALEKIIQRPFNVNEWGSCQYTTALNTYELLLLLDHYEIPFEKVGIYFTQKGVVGQVASYLPNVVQEKIIDDPLKQLSREEAYQALEMDVLTFTRRWVKEDMMEEEERTQHWETCKKCTEGDEFKLDPIMDVYRNTSRDLWSAAKKMTETIFPNLKIQVGSLTKDLHGPRMNQWVQSNNSVTGAQCYLLKKYSWIKDDTSFADFDT